MADLASLTDRIKAAFPDLAFDRATLNGDGDDHAVVLLDDAWVFRFPRDDRHRARLFPVELNLLAALDGATRVPIPRYERLPPGRAFGGYRMIRGDPLRPADFAGLPAGVREAILDDLADFLSVIHSLPPAILAQSDGTIALEWAAERFRRRWLEKRRAQVAIVVPTALLKNIDHFYDAYASAPAPPREVVTHGDLTDDHMLLAQRRDRLAGVIDFGDACLGDPAYDFAFFFAYGQAAADQLAGRYDPVGDDPTLLARARGHFIRFRVEQLRRRATMVDIEAILCDLPGRLAAYFAEAT